MTSPAAFMEIRGRTGEIARLEVLLDGGPLCIAGVWRWGEGTRVTGLYRIYHRRSGFTLGPFYASISLAEKGMKKALSLGRGFWEQPLGWYPRQAWFGEWIDKNLGKYDDLVGGIWASD